jgi:hypothetical protein
MAHDLIFGKLARDWSCGAVLSLADVKDPKSLEYDLFATRDAKRIGSLAKEEIQKNFATIVKLDTAKRLPIAVRKEFGAFMRKWVDFNYARNSKYAERDFVALMNFREANKRFTERLAIFDQLAKTPLKQPVAPTLGSSPSLVPFRLPSSQAPITPRPWGWLLGLGLGLAGLGFIAGKARPAL